jgi:hypothetical protein
MKLLQSKRLLLMGLLLIGACKQNDFYQKANLSEIGVENVDPTSIGTTVNKDPIPVIPDVVSTPVANAQLIDKNEIFTQKTIKNGDVDILWVIDDSGSMEDNQTALANNLSTFITNFLKFDVDFKMAITTTDGTKKHNGIMVGDANALTYSAAKANQAKFISNFKSLVQVGTQGSGIEQGLKCAKSFFDRYSSSFLRTDANLAIVFISDEEDQSDLKVDEYVSYYKTLKKNPGMVKTYSIVTQKLLPDQQWESIGLRYNYLSNKTAGYIGDLDKNFYTTLGEIGTNITSLVDSFIIADAPYLGKIQVLVNGVEIKTGFTFNAKTRAITFNSQNIPINGSNITVKYQVVKN